MFPPRRLFDVRQRLLQAPLPQQEVSPGGLYFSLQSRSKGIAQGASEGIFCIVEPVEFGVATRHPGSGLTRHQRLCLIVAGDIGESGGSFEKLPLLILRFAHQEPGLLEEGIELLTLQKGLLLGRKLLAAPHHGTPLDGMQLDSFLTLGDSHVEVGLAHTAGRLVAHHEEGQQLGIIVLVASFLRLAALNESLASVEIGIVAGCEGLPSPTSGGVLLGRAGRQQGYHQQQPKGEKGTRSHSF